MNISPFGHIPEISSVLEMQRAMSRARDEQEFTEVLIEHFQEYSGASHVITVSIEGLSEGDYRLLERYDLTQNTGRTAKADQDPPVTRSGQISEIVRDASPKVVSGLSPEKDEILAGFIDCEKHGVAFPMFERGSVMGFLILLHDSPREPTPTEMRAGISNVNLIARAYHQFRMNHELGVLHQRLNGQINELGRLQRSLLPGSAPDEPRLSFAVSYEPSEAAGGDYYDYREFGNGSIGIVIADVSGHGPVASVAMAIMRTAMHAFRMYEQPSERTSRDLNTLLLESLDAGTFVTAFFVSIDPATGDAGFMRCGHNPPRVRRATGEIITLDAGGGPPLGMLPEIDSAGDTVRLNAGDTLVLYTDGITEAFSPDGNLFGTDRLDEAIRAGRGDPERTRRAILDSVAAHAGIRPRDDDQTLVIVRYNGTGESEQ